jgi:hypothetical protein
LCIAHSIGSPSIVRTQQRALRSHQQGQSPPSRGGRQVCAHRWGRR